MSEQEATIKQHRRDRFVQVPNNTARDSCLSWKATGLLCYLLSLPDGWKINLAHLSSAKRDGRDATRAGMKELENARYLIKSVQRDEAGRITGTAWHVSDYPFSENPVSENPKADNPPAEKPTLRILYTKNTDLKKTTSAGGGASVDELLEAAEWSQSLTAKPRNPASWRAKVRNRLKAGPTSDDLDALDRYRRHLAAAAAADERLAHIEAAAPRTNIRSDDGDEMLAKAKRKIEAKKMASRITA